MQRGQVLQGPGAQPIAGAVSALGRVQLPRNVCPDEWPLVGWRHPIGRQHNCAGLP